MNDTRQVCIVCQNESRIIKGTNISFTLTISYNLIFSLQKSCTGMSYQRYFTLIISCDVLMYMQVPPVYVLQFWVFLLFHIYRSCMKSSRKFRPLKVHIYKYTYNEEIMNSKYFWYSNKKYTRKGLHIKVYLLYII